MVVWESFNADGDGWGIFAQRYTSTGTPDGSEFQVNTTTSQDQRYPDIAMDLDGDHLVVWMDQANDGDGWGVYGQRYDNTNATYLSQFRLSTTTAGHQRNPKVAMTPDGQYVMVWAQVALDGSAFGIYARYYLANGSAISSEIEVVAPAATYVAFPDVAVDPDGNFTVVWQENGSDGAGAGIFARQFDNTGAALASAFQVNTYATNNQSAPVIAMDSAGAFVVAWTSYGQDGDGDGIYAQLFLANGTADGSEFLVSNTTSGSQNHPVVTKTRNGDMTFGWTSYGQDGSFDGAYIRPFTAWGIALDPETRINTTTSLFQEGIALVHVDIEDELITTWQDGLANNSSTADGDAFGVFMQRYALANPLPAEWLDFTAKATGPHSATLNWTIGPNAEVQSFEVQRSQGNLSSLIWQSVGSVPAQTTATSAHYIFEDPQVGPGLYYYQLRQIDRNGGENISEIRSVQIGGLGSIPLLYPNPVREKLFLRFANLDDGSYPFRITTNLGRVAQTGTLTIAGGKAHLLLSEMPNGVYFLQIERVNSREAFRFVKQ